MQEHEIDLAKLNQGNIDSFINQIETNIKQRAQKYGNEDQKFLKYNQVLCKLLNQQALIALQIQNFEVSLKYLKKAELLTSCVPELKTQTLSNLACYYRKVGKTRTALQYLQQALNIELNNETLTKVPELYLNLCAILSQQERHEEATQHIYLSIIMLQHDLLLQLLKQNYQQIEKETTSKPNISEMTNYQFKISQTLKSTEQKILNKDQLERIQILIVAYHNLGVEMEHLKKGFESKNIFKQAFQLSQFTLPDNHPLKSTIGQIIKKLDKVEQKDNFEIVIQKTNLPKLHLKSYDVKQVLKETSPKIYQNKKHQSLPKNNSNIGSKEDKRNLSSERTKVDGFKFLKTNEFNQEHYFIIENKDSINLRDLQITLDTANQTMM